MRADLLYSTQQSYLWDTTTSIELYEGSFLQMFGRGEGSVDWDGKSGRIEWTNFPSRRPDGVYLPDITGLIRLTGSDYPIMYRMHGISLLPDHNDRRLFAGPVRWFTDHPDLLWLNDRWGYEEGELDRETLAFRTNTHVLHPDPPR